MARRNLYYNYISHPNYYEDGGLVGRPSGVQLIPIETKGISPSDAVNPNAGNEGGGNKFLDFMNNSGGGGWANAIAPAATNIANAFLDTEASTADRVAGALGIPALANQWRADTSKGDAYIKDMQNSMDLNSKNYIQDASSSWGGANAVKQNLKTNISPISFNSAVPSLKDFKGNWWRNMGASVAQGAASGSVGGHWGALGGAVTGLLGSIGGLFGRSKRAERAYKDFLAKRNTLVSAQEAAYNRAVKDQTLSNMQALANGNMSQRINDMANIRAFGGNLFANGGGLIDPDPSFDDWYKTVPSDRNDTTSYNLRRAYELAPKEDLENWRTATPDELISGEKHLNSVYYNEDTGEYEFMKSKNHPTLKYELDWYYGDTPEATDFREKYNLDKSGEYYKYIPNNTEYAMGGNLYTDLSPNMMNLWNNKQQIDQQKVNTQQMNFGLGNSFNYKNMFPNGGDLVNLNEGLSWYDILFGDSRERYAEGVTEPSYVVKSRGTFGSDLARRAYFSEQAVENARKNRASDIEFWDRYRNDWGDRTPDYANMSEEEFIKASESDDPNFNGLPLSDYNRYKYRKYLNYPKKNTFNNAYLFMPDINELRKKYPLKDLPVYQKNGSWYLKEGVPASNGYKNLEEGGHKIRPQDFQDTIDELRRRAWENEFYDYSYDSGDDLPNPIKFEGNPNLYYKENGKYINDKGEEWSAGDFNDIRQMLRDGQATDPNKEGPKLSKRDAYLKYKREQEEKARKREEEGHVDDYWHKEIDENFMSNPVVEHDEIVIKGDKSKKSDNIEYKPTQRQTGYKKLSEDLGGSEGVKHFQEQYNLYHPESPIKVDGKVGDETVRAFQSWNNEYGSDNVYGLKKLDVDGIYGEKSQEFMSSGIAKRNLEFAYGGKLFANGGQMNSSDLPENMQYYANGGTHEENPYGGIQVGTDQQGNPNLVEEGEFRWGDYIFSDRINVDPTLLSRYNLAPATRHQGKKANKGKLSYADMAKKYAKKNNELANDPIGKNTLEAYMKRLQDAQEDQKFQDSMEQQKQDAINQYRKTLSTPTQGNPMYGAMKYNGMGNAATQQGVNAGMSDLGQQGSGNEVLSNTNRSGNNMLHAFGGNLFWDGGTPQIKPKLLNVNPNLVLGNDYMDRWTINNTGTPRLFSSTIPMYTGENPEANFTAYQKRYPTLPSDAKGMQQLLVNEGFDIGNTGPNKDGVDGIWGDKSRAAWYDFLRAYNHRPNTINQYDFIGSNNQPSTSNSQTSYNGGLNLGVRDGDATTDANNSGNGQTSYGNAEGNIGTRSSLTDGIKRDTTTTFGTAAVKEDPKQVPHYSTAGEYAMFGKGLTPMIWDWMNKTNTKYDPNQRPAYELADMGNNSTFLRTADTIGGYRAPNLMDAERMNNAAQAQGIAALQAALNVGNGNRGFAAAQTAQNAYNTQMDIGNNYATTQQINNDERFKNDSFNTALDQANANIRNSMYQDNQKAQQVGQNMAIDAKKYANDYILRNELYADATNRQAMENRAANQTTWTDNALNYFIAQAQKNDILNAKNNDITNPYWTDKNGVIHYIGDSGLNSAIYDAFTSGDNEWGNYAVNNGTFTGDRLKEWNKLQEKYSAADLKAHPELWKSLVLQEKQARKKEADKADKAKSERVANARYAFDNNMAQLNNYRAIYGDKFTNSQYYDDLMKRYNDKANATEFNDINNLDYWNRIMGDEIDYWRRYNTPVTAQQSAYGGYINNNNKSNKREYYNYMRR